MPRLEKSIVVAAPSQAIWEYAVDPARWHTWFVGLSAPKSIQGDGCQGTVVAHDITVGSISIPIVTTVVTFDPDCCWKAEYTGLMTRGFQQCTYGAVDGGTELVFVGKLLASGILPNRLAKQSGVTSWCAALSSKSVSITTTEQPAGNRGRSSIRDERDS